MSQATKRTRVMIADDRARVRFALKVLLEQQADIEVVGEAVHADGLPQQVQLSRPDVLLLDWGLPGLTCLCTVQEVRSASPDLRVVVLSGHPEAGREAMQAGADAFFNKTEAPERLLTVIHCSEHPGEEERQ